MKSKLEKFSCILVAYSVIILLVSIFSQSFAEFYTVTISAFIRFVFSAITGIVSFSLAEILVILLPFVLIAVVIIILYFSFKSRKKLVVFVKRFCFVLFILASIFINTFAVCYFRQPIEENMNLDRKKLIREEMYLSTEFIKNKLETSLSEIDFSDSGASINPYTFKETERIIDKGYDNLRREYPFISNIISSPKPIFLSEPMTYTHISGVYFPFTGEANVNVNYPDYVVVYSIAHEKAHQRGIASEDDANFAAFLACIMSENEYVRYAALMSMYDYYLDSIYATDYEMYVYFIQNTSDKVLSEMISYSNFFDKYRHSVSSKVADKVNDSYIKVMGDKSGVNSYGKVVELVSAYIDNKRGLPK